MMSKKVSSTDSGLQIAGFVCNWGAYSGVEMAGMEKREYPANIKLVKLPCLGRLNLGHILKAFELGASGVVLLGCPPEDCSYESGVNKAKEVMAQAKQFMHLLGIDRRRLTLIEVPISRGDIVASQLTTFARQINRLDTQQVKTSERIVSPSGKGI